MQTALIVGNVDEAIVDWLIDPFRFHQRKIRARLQLKLVYEKTNSLEDIDQALQSHSPDILFFGIDWSVPVEDVIKFLKSIYDQADRPKIVYLDHTCLSSSPYFQAAPYVDAYVRKQLLNPITDYNDKTFIGNNIYADYVANRYDTDLDGWQFGAKIPDNHINKVLAGWNLATANTLSRPSRYPLLRKFQRRSKKTLDLTCRVNLTEDGDKNSMYYIHRVHCMEAVVAIEDKFTIGHNANGERITYKAFHREMRQSRLGLSPFGWGEITDRDFRIINSHTLLIKPDMSHLQTNPDIFRAGETYAPVKWDFSNLEEVVEYYLSHPKETREICDHAIRVYDDYYRNDCFVDKLDEIITLAEKNHAQARHQPILASGSITA